MKIAVIGAALALSALQASPAAAYDEAAAQALAKTSGCLKCHSVDKKKDAPPYKEIAAKYKGRADAEQKLYVHLTTSPKVKVDGKEELHENLQSKSDAEIRNFIRWALSR